MTEHLETRTTYVKLENEWKYINQSLIHTWKIKKTPNLTDIRIVINTIKVAPSSQTSTHFIYDWPTIRAKWNDMFGENESECNFMALEDDCHHAQLEAINYYTNSPLSAIRGCLFTPKLTVDFKPYWRARAQNLPTKLEVEEVCVLSDAVRARNKEMEAKKAQEQAQNE